MNGWMIGIGLTGGNGAVIGADGGTSGIVVTDPPPPPKGVGLGMNIGELALKPLLRFLRSA